QTSWPRLLIASRVLPAWAGAATRAAARKTAEMLGFASFMGFSCGFFVRVGDLRRPHLTARPGPRQGIRTSGRNRGGARGEVAGDGAEVDVLQLRGDGLEPGTGRRLGVGAHHR